MIEISKPFDSYVTYQALPRTGDAQRFEVRITYEIEGTGRIESRQLEWSYSGTQEAIDEKAGVDGLTGRRARATAQLRGAIENELKATGQRLYSAAGQPFLIRGRNAENSN